MVDKFTVACRADTQLQALFSKKQSQNSNWSLFCDPISSNFINFIHSANFVFLEQHVLYPTGILYEMLANTNS